MTCFFYININSFKNIIFRKTIARFLFFCIFKILHPVWKLKYEKIYTFNQRNTYHSNGIFGYKNIKNKPFKKMLDPEISSGYRQTFLFSQWKENFSQNVFRVLKWEVTKLPEFWTFLDGKWKISWLKSVFFYLGFLGIESLIYLNRQSPFFF